MAQPFPVHSWIGLGSDIILMQGILVVGLSTPPNMPRIEVRQKIRHALREILATVLDCSVKDIELSTQAGQAPRLLKPALDIGLSISHEPNYSLIAINKHGKVGVDLMAINSIPVTHEIYSLAMDYLGSEISDFIINLPVELQQLAFAKAWTALEARLKYYEVALIEYSPERDSRLTEIIVSDLKVPDGYIATLAF